MTRFQRTRLGEVAAIRGGKRLAIGEEFTLDDTGHPYIRARDIGGGAVTIVDPVFISPVIAQRLRRYTVSTGDVCITIVGANVGDMGSVPAKLHGANLTENAVKITSNGRANQAFLKYALLSTDAHQQMKVLAGGAAQPKLGIYKIETIEIPLPPLDEQRRMASILSAYDDLIENNTRRIAILEEMARRIYEEWFVRLRFPNHENVRMIESELGLVPKGWKSTTLGTVCAYINRGLAPKYDDNAPGIIINQKCIRDQRLNLLEARRQGKAVPKDKLVMPGDVLINSTGVGTLGRVAQIMESLEACTVDTHVSIVRPSSEIDHDFFGLALFSKQPHFEAQGVGSTGQTELSRGRIAETVILLPPKSLQDQFGKLVRPMRQLAVRLQAKNVKLHAIRDLLLPKLISGELDVSAIPEPEAAAA